MPDLLFELPFIFTVLCYLFTLLGVIRYSSKKMLADAILLFSLLLILFIHYSSLIWIMYYFAPWENLFILVIFTTPIPIILLIVLIFSIFVKIYYKLTKSSGKSGISSRVKQRRLKIQNWKPVYRDLLRKIPHIAIFFSFFLIWYIGASFVYAAQESFEGMFPEETDLLNVFLKTQIDKGNIFWHLFYLGWFYFFLLIVLYCFAFSTILMEFTRKSKNFSFPFNFITIHLLKDEEIESFGTFMYFFVGHLFVTTFVAPLPFFAIMSMSSIGDLVASQVGIRTGRFRIKWNNKKCWEGSISATLVSFIITSMFVGIAWGLIFAITFLITDIVLREPLNASDNLLIPICSTIIFVIFHHLGLPYSSIFF